MDLTRVVPFSNFKILILFLIWMNGFEIGASTTMREDISLYQELVSKIVFENRP